MFLFHQMYWCYLILSQKQHFSQIQLDGFLLHLGWNHQRDVVVYMTHLKADVGWCWVFACLTALLSKFEPKWGPLLELRQASKVGHLSVCFNVNVDWFDLCSDFDCLLQSPSCASKDTGLRLAILAVWNSVCKMCIGFMFPLLYHLMISVKKFGFKFLPPNFLLLLFLNSLFIAKIYIVSVTCDL